MKQSNEVKEKALKLPPPSCTVPGSNFTVDWHNKTDPKYIHSFLSHAHSDHTSGIGSFKPPRVLHCTSITLKMLILKFPKVAPTVVTHEYNQVFKVDGWKITFFDAHHTPGSALIMFISPKGKKILHTGDFRAEKSVMDAIKTFSPLDHLFIDCTFGTSKLKIPPRDECITFISIHAKEELKKGGISAILTYTTGKEDLIYEVAIRVNSIIYVPPNRMPSINGLLSCGWGTPQMFTSDPTASHLHLMSIMGFDSNLAADHAIATGCNSITLFRATGWNGVAFWQSPEVEVIKGVRVTTYNVPYSDHCSIEELKSFVEMCKPAKFTPTTTSSKRDIDKLTALFGDSIGRERNRGFLDFYAKK